MDHHSDQPLPPGVQRVSFSSHLLPETAHSTPPVLNNDNIKNPSHSHEGSLFPITPNGIGFSPPESLKPHSTSSCQIHHTHAMNVVSQMPNSSQSVPVPSLMYSGGSPLHPENTNDIDNSVQSAVMREQEIATQKVIQNQREARSIGEHRDNTDLFSGSQDPNTLKEHLLKITAEHRTEMALKHGRPVSNKEAVSPCNFGRDFHYGSSGNSLFVLLYRGNMEIGNGYGVPGGGAYYGSLKTSIITSNPVLGHSTNESNPECSGGSGCNSATKELPEFLKKKLRARGILKGDPTMDYTPPSNRSDMLPSQKMLLSELPPGWIEAHDPASGVAYYYDANTGKSQWEKPIPPQIPENWQELVDETTGQKYYYNTLTNVSQWENPFTFKQTALQLHDANTTTNMGQQSSILPKCKGCGGWGVSLVQSWGYCRHCTRVLNLPQSQYLLENAESKQHTNASGPKEDSEKKFQKQRSSFKPPTGKGDRRDNRKRTHSEDEDLDPMDPSSYSDAPRGGWQGCRTKRSATTGSRHNCHWSALSTATVPIAWSGIAEKC
ncbi:unnamed protein product [Cuscuta epithymum]|uniref:Polyglutamine-binding protein 1 n=1 Tax=Cuscuta epithymum TaxID=186058 RepID=A0AAV0EZ09_9ASTE|nr:unnamed protein product [Cuscuta epithymum]